jgi:hypothetical protein
MVACFATETSGAPHRKQNSFFLALQLANEWLGCWQFQHLKVFVDLSVDSSRLTECFEVSFAVLARELVLAWSLLCTYANSGFSTHD